MNRIANRASYVLAACVFFCGTQAMATADPTPDSGASVVFLRTNCDVAGSPKENCFESMANLMTWTWGTRSPSSSDRLRIDVGPGNFGPFECPSDNGWVSLYGSGRLTTVLEGLPTLTSAGTKTVGGISEGCTELEFADVTFRGTYAGFWWSEQGGSSQWQSVDIDGLDSGGTGSFNETFSWLEEPGGCGEESPIATHYFFDSRVIAHGSQTSFYAPAPFWTGCSDVWFYGGEITWNAAPISALGALVDVGTRGKMQTFGSALRVVSTTSGVYSGITGVKTSSDDSVFHMHGGIVSLNLPDATSGFVYSIWASSGSLVHTPGTAFATLGSVTAYRIYNLGGTVSSPFLWQASASPPAITSQHGSDVFVETDCASSGLCNASGSEAHMMVYDTSCSTNGTWRDLVTGNCRQ